MTLKRMIPFGTESSAPSNNLLPRTLVDNSRTFEWPRASDLKELVIGSRA